MSYPLFVVFGSFVVPLVFTFKSVGEAHSATLMTKAIQRASRAKLESVFATKITKVTKVWRKWGIITTKYPEKYEKGGERLIEDNSPYPVAGIPGVG